MNIEVSEWKEIVSVLEGLTFGRIIKITEKGRNMLIDVVDVPDGRFDCSRVLLTLVDVGKFEFDAFESIFDVLYSDPVRITELHEITVNRLEISTAKMENNLFILTCIPESDESVFSIGELVFSCRSLMIESEPRE